MVHRSSVPMHWRLYESRYNLVGNKCLVCGEFFYPSKIVCPNCRRRGILKRVVFSGKGKIYSYTIIRNAPRGFEKYAPYVVAIIELDEGPRVMGWIVDSKISDIKIGQRVSVVFRKIYEDGKEGLIHYGFKFRVIDENNQLKD